MHTDEYEQAFAKLLEQEYYDEAEKALFNLARMSFEAGLVAAGGNPYEVKESLKKSRQEYPIRSFFKKYLTFSQKRLRARANMRAREEQPAKQKPGDTPQ